MKLMMMQLVMVLMMVNGGGDFVGDDGDTNLATKHDTTLGSGSVA